MKKTDLNLKKLLKITEKLTMEMTDLEYIEPNFYLCADEFAEYCPKMANNLIELDKLNLIEAAIYLYYSAANTADNLILNKEEFLKTFKKFDSNLSLILNDETVLKTILSKFNNVLQFINYISSVKNDFYEDDSCLLLIEASYLYLYLEIASSLDKYEEFSRYSFNPEDFVIVSEEEPVKKDDLVKLIVNYYTENPNLINDNILDFIVDFDNVVVEIIEKNNQLVPTKKTELKDESVKKET
ncbi:MAG: hypothetical protein PHF21_04065, partial [Bacilli bacterium]|nr:hypothetical protein [Bacilli bacterium]